ncbi:hypothetical protein N9Y92_03435 [Chlamydiales bacterium]|nr:hypothetical protein [Chlamydiales bacterium]
MYLVFIFFFSAFLYGTPQEDLHLANTYLELEAPENAIPIYHELLASSLNREQKGVITYNLALAYLNANKPNEALSYLQELSIIPQLNRAILNEIKTVANRIIPFDEKGLKDTSDKFLKEESKTLEPIDQAIIQQKWAMELTMRLSFLNPYATNLYKIPLEYQKRLLTLSPALVRQIKNRQNEFIKKNLSLPPSLWENITAHFQAGLDYADLAMKSLTEKKLPWVEVIPLQTLAIGEWEKGEALIKTIENRAQALEGEKGETRSLNQERLKEMFEQDENGETIDHEIKEGLWW